MSPAETQSNRTLPKTQYKCNGFNGYNGNCIGFNGIYNGVYWYVMYFIGGMLNPILENEFCYGFIMIYNGILMETIEMSVMVSIGLLLFFLARSPNAGAPKSLLVLFNFASQINVRDVFTEKQAKTQHFTVCWIEIPEEKPSFLITGSVVDDYRDSKTYPFLWSLLQIQRLNRCCVLC